MLSVAFERGRRTGSVCVSTCSFAFSMGRAFVFSYGLTASNASHRAGGAIIAHIRIGCALRIGFIECGKLWNLCFEDGYTVYFCRRRASPAYCLGRSMFIALGTASVA
jgi:hypothetical protein